MTTPHRLVCIGLSHHTAPVAVREQLSLGPDGLAAILDEHTGDGERALLSTCNRFEVYAALPDGSGETLLDCIAERRGVDRDALEPHLYRRDGLDVVRHLARVAAGLDSIVLGEPQILGQVGEALNRSVAHHRAGPYLRALFRTALRAGKRARAETGISRKPLSISSMAVRLARRRLGSLAGLRIAVVGTGEMGRLIVKTLRPDERAHLTLVNRRVEAARAFAGTVGAEAAPLERLPELLASADLLFFATGAPEPLLRVDAVRAAGREERPLTLIDIGLPRNVAPAVAALPNVHLFDLDRLRGEVERSLTERRRSIPAVERIIEEEVERFAQWQREHTVQPVIVDLRRQAEAIRRQELQRALDALPDADEKVREQLQFLSQTLVKKLLHHPTMNLREEALRGEPQPYAHVVRRLFGLTNTDAS